MRKLKLDLDMLRVDSFATGTSTLQVAEETMTRCGTTLTCCGCAHTGLHEDCGNGTVRAAQEPTWILTCPHSCDPRCPDPPTVTPTCTCKVPGGVEAFMTGFTCHGSQVGSTC